MFGPFKKKDRKATPVRSNYAPSTNRQDDSSSYNFMTFASADSGSSACDSGASFDGGSCGGSD